MLLDRRANVNAKTEDGRTPLFLANAEVAVFLRERGAEDIAVAPPEADVVPWPTPGGTLGLGARFLHVSAGQVIRLHSFGS